MDSRFNIPAPAMVKLQSDVFAERSCRLKVAVAQADAETTVDVDSSKWCGNPFFRSYGARLPSSLTRFHSLALVYSTHPPVSVYGTGGHGNITKIFSVSDLKNPHRP